MLVLLGLCLAVAAVLHVGADALVTHLSRIGPEAIWLLGPYAAGTSVGAFPWRWLLPKGVSVGVGAVVASRFAASGANALLPFFGLAGEPARLLWLAPGARPAGTAALVIDRVVYNSSSAVFLLFGAIVAARYTSLPSALAATAGLTAVVILALTLFICWGVARFGVGNRLQRALRHLLGKTYAPNEFGSRVDQDIRRVLSEEHAAIGLGFAVHFVGRVLLALEAQVALWVLDAPSTLAMAMVVASVPVATSLVASSIPSQVGVQESAHMLVCGALGLDPAVGVALSVLQRMRQLVFVPFVPLLLGLAPREPAPQGGTPLTES